MYLRLSQTWLKWKCNYDNNFWTKVFNCDDLWLNAVRIYAVLHVLGAYGYPKHSRDPLNIKKMCNIYSTRHSIHQYFFSKLLYITFIRILPHSPSNCNDSWILRSDQMYSAISQSLESGDIGCIRKQLRYSCSSC